MLGVWGGSFLILLVLPFQLLAKPLTTYGVFVLATFVLAFVVGGLLVPQHRAGGIRVSPGRVLIDYGWAENILMLSAVIAVFAFCIDLSGHNFLDISANQELRSQRAATLLKAETSISTVWFQIAFLTYPAAYAYIALHTIYSRRVAYWKLGIFGFLPVLLAILSMGGRSPLLYAFAICGLSLFSRPNRGKFFARMSLKTILVMFGAVLIVAAAGYYFSVIFLVRSQVVGGPEAMFKIAESVWGIGFKGPLSTYIFSVFGESLSYLIFIFTWYFIQGLVIASYIFSGYDGPMQFGVYGIDLVSALMRRVDPGSVAQGFDSLLSLGTYGFFPSAFGSLYVDFGLFGLLLSGLWGYSAALCYRKIKYEKKTSWLIFAPFVSAGIIFSLINTPLGFANGFVSHLWMLLAFCLMKTRKVFVVPAAATSQ
jgi:oligosaccharide repeat unit polymerase